MKTQAASKEIPDITIVNPAAQMKPFVDAKLFAPLNDMLDQNGLKDTYQSGLLDYYSFDGNVYALPDGNNIEVVYYNKELFEQAGIADTPKTFDELLQDVKTLKAKGITPIAIGEKDSWTGSFLFMNILLRTNGGPGFLQDVLDGKKTFEDPAFVEAVDRFKTSCKQVHSQMEQLPSMLMQVVISSNPVKLLCGLSVHGKQVQLTLPQSLVKQEPSNSQALMVKGIQMNSCSHQVAPLRFLRTVSIYKKRKIS